MNPKRTLKSTALILSIIFMLVFEVTLSLGDTQLTSSVGNDWHPAITQTSDNKIWVIWHSDRTGNTEIFYNVHNGTSWSGDTQLTTNASVDAIPSITQASDGKIWVVWTSNRRGAHYDIFYKTKPLDASSWSLETPLTDDPNNDKHPSITTANDGRLWMFWESNRTGHNDIFYKFSSDNGASWSADTNATNTTDLYDDREPSTAQDRDGKIWVVWSRLGSSWDIFYKTFDGVSWSADTPLTSDLNSDASPSITRTSDGAIWVVWQSNRPDGQQSDIYYRIFSGAYWSSENKLTWYMDTDAHPAIFQTANQTIWLVWSVNKDTNFEIFYKFVVVDLAIKSVTPSATSVPQGNLVNITVVVRNEGTAGATFTLTTYYNNSVIKTETKTLIPGLIPYYTIHTWNTTGVTVGNYIISAKLSPIPGETDTTDNTYVVDPVTVGIHDVAVKNVTLSRSLVHRGYTMTEIYVEVRNEGTFTEIFTVTAYGNSTKIGKQTLTLYPNANTTLTLAWDTQSVPYGYYTVRAEVSPLVGESDTVDNSFTDGKVTITIAGDINADRIVDGVDVTPINAHWYDPPVVGLLGYDTNADINNDGRVDLFDAAVINVNFDKSW